MTVTKTDQAEAEARAKATLRMLKRVRGMSDERIARQIEGISRQSVQGYLAGDTHITAGFAAAFASVLNVPLHVLFMDQADAMTWLTEHDDQVRDGRAFQKEVWVEQVTALPAESESRRRHPTARRQSARVSGRGTTRPRNRAA